MAANAFNSVVINIILYLADICIRDVTKFEFEFNNVELQSFSTDSKFNKCFKHFVVELNSCKDPCYTTDFICTESQRAQRNLFFP